LTGFWEALTIQLLLGVLAGGLTGVGVRMGSGNLGAIGALLMFGFLWLTYSYMPVDLVNVLGVNYEDVLGLLAGEFGKYSELLKIPLMEIPFLFGLLVGLVFGIKL